MWTMAVLMLPAALWALLGWVGLGIGGVIASLAIAERFK